MKKTIVKKMFPNLAVAMIFFFFLVAHSSFFPIKIKTNFSFNGKTIQKL
jgi:hypothetical protein